MTPRTEFGPPVNNPAARGHDHRCAGCGRRFAIARPALSVVHALCEDCLFPNEGEHPDQAGWRLAVTR